MTTDLAGRLQQHYRRLTEATDLRTASAQIKGIGLELGLTHPAVVDDYSQRRLLAAEDGAALSEVFGWERDFQRDWVEQGLHRVSPVGAVSRLTTRPFSWTSAQMTALAEELGGRSGRSWHLTPERGIAGGISVPVHLPRCGVGSVTWTTRNPDIDLNQILEQHGDLLRLAAFRFMDLVYAGRQDEPQEPSATPLSEREIECLTWVALGRTDGEIAALIHRSPTTARFHVENAMGKLGARNRAQAVALACQLGLIHANGSH
ncbi:MAG: LuxR C-terminal-related transcriptional regulator [Pseudomonadales bacterium]